MKRHKGGKCRCKFCKRSKELDRIKKRIPKEAAKFMDDLFEDLFHTEEDLCVANAIIEGTWTDADRHIRVRREKLRTKIEEKEKGQRTVVLACCLLPVNVKNPRVTPSYVFDHSSDKTLQIKNRLLRSGSQADLRQLVHDEIDSMFFSYDKYMENV